MSEYVRKRPLLDRINTIRNAHIEKRNEGDECDQFANEAVADWLGIIHEEIESGAFDIPLIGIEEYYTMERRAAKANWEVERLRTVLERIRKIARESREAKYHVENYTLIEMVAEQSLSTTTQPINAAKVERIECPCCGCEISIKPKTELLKGEETA